MFLFKQKSQDFIVEEILPFELTGKGDALYVYIEKRNKNTYDIIQHLCRTFKISRKTVGIAGLKDKKAMARQRISIYKRALGQLGGQEKRIAALKHVAIVKDVKRHMTPLNMSTGISNRFHIRLRAEKALSQSEKEKTIKVLNVILKNGYANVYGTQRFGINGRNSHQGREIIEGTSKLLKTKHPDRKEIVFKLQAYASSIFNSYFMARRRMNHTGSSRFKNKRKPKIMDGDIVHMDVPVDGMHYGSYNATDQNVQLFADTKTSLAYKHPKRVGKKIPYDGATMHLTGPVPGHDLLLPTPTSDAGQYEHQFLKDQGLKQSHIKTFESRKVYGLRRRLWVQPTDTSVRLQGDDVLLDFTLPAGSYASTVVNEMMKKVAIKEINYKKQGSKPINKSKKISKG